MTGPVDPTFGVNPPPPLVPTTNPTKLASADDALAKRVKELRETIDQLQPDVARIKTNQKTVWNWLKGGGILIGFDVFITIIGIILGFNVYSVSHQNDDLITQLQAQQTKLNTSIHETCNLYGTFIGFYSDAAKGRFAGGPGQYDQLYRTLQTSADHLDCGIKHVVPGT